MILHVFWGSNPSPALIFISKIKQNKKRDEDGFAVSQSIWLD